MVDTNTGQDGPVIFLHGASSAGKTTLARALLPLLDRPFWHLSIDHMRDGGIWQADRWRTERIAHFAGFHAMIGAVVRSGNAVLLEHILDKPDFVRQLRHALGGCDLFFVGLHTPVSELTTREAARGDRPLGSAELDAATIHQGHVYDLDLDGTERPEANARTLLDSWLTRSPRSSFFTEVQDA